MRLWWFLLAATSLAQVPPPDSCSEGLTRVQSRDEVVDNFKFLTAKFFVGQSDAYDSTLVALRKFTPRSMLLLHYVGASGTGKTLLANIVQRSFFHRNQCPNFSVFGYRLCAPTSTFETSRLHLVGTKTCGVAYLDFLNVEGDELTRRAALERTIFKALKSTRTSTHHSPAIVFLDNFNLCKHKCEQFLSKLVVERRLNGQPIANVVFLITSDLSQEGLRLVPGEDRALALKRVLQVAEETWGEDSMWNDRAHVVPFSPYTDQDLSKIFDLVLREVEHEVRLNVEQRLLEERDRTQRSSVRWVGRFKFSDKDRLLIMARLYKEILSRHARAFEKIKGKLLAATLRPQPIEQVLVSEHEPVESTQWEFKDLLGGLKSKYMFGTQPGLTGVEYQQDIVFRAVEDNRFVVAEVDDIAQFYHPKPSGKSNGDRGDDEL
ncbi:hypothetical protein BASA81_009822 [Batrachochytrium salamandrivorans]|nr:hypothetical protein BASA81_009822 [Batrachochytrium salamandrivorans]